MMNLNFSDIKQTLVPKNHYVHAVEAQKSEEILKKELIKKGKLPENGWGDDQIEELVRELAKLDSNNFARKSGLGEREARIACSLVARRHYNFGHGIGRSGDLLEAQPKAAGSTLMANLTNLLLLDLIQEMGIRACCRCFLVPLATGMTLTLCMLSLKKTRPAAKYVLWSRIDQKSCFKCITTADLIPIIIDPILTAEMDFGTNVESFKTQINNLGASNILCIFSTTSCFAPRNCDDVVELSRIAEQYEVPHIVNNAYGLQSNFITHKLMQAHQQGGRIDIFVQSTDKNLMVPVGGAIVAGFNEETVENVAKTYAGRASSSQTLDVFMTLLSLGRNGYRRYVKERKNHFQYLGKKLRGFAVAHGESVINSRNNPISLALTLDTLSLADNQITKLGSMLYTRGISGARVISKYGKTKSIDGYAFENWGGHNSHTRLSYLTVAAALGVTKAEIDVFFQKLEECWQKCTSH